jgi:hypothetical protein
MSALVWGSLGAVTALLVVMTWQVLTHDPSICRECVDREAAARRRHPSRQGAVQ